jgi:hypothetical protein
MVFAGVGTPINLSDCLVSTLYFANLYPPAADTIKAARAGRTTPVPSWVYLAQSPLIANDLQSKTYIIIPGATAKETVSAIESNSFPSFEEVFNILATWPSSPSATNAATKNQKALIGAALSTQIIAQQPKNKLARVIRSGMCFFIFSKQIS